MRRLPLERLGARELPGNEMQFGFFLPWVSAANGFKMWVKVIHERDQFIQEVQPKVFDLWHSPDPDYLDYWSTRVRIDASEKTHPKSNWGSPGRYVYRFALENPAPKEGQERYIDWIIDPFAREFGVGKLSAFTLGYQQYNWSGNEHNWKTPKIDDLILYELMINEFGGDIKRTIDHLDYLSDLGVNCIEIMPVSNVANTIDWGFLPIGYFGVDERFGRRSDMQRLIDEAHSRNMAVILDSVYGHTSENFPYSYVYKKLGYGENPFMGNFAKNYYGESTDFRRAFTRDFFYTVNMHWLECYHADGFRYDCVPDYWDGPMGVGYADLTYETYQSVRAKNGEGHWQRFFRDGEVTLIQCAEQLEEPRQILTQTYSNCTWQNETLDAAEKVAHGRTDELTRLGLQFGLVGYPDSVSNNGDRIRKTAIHYLENHDHSRFVCNFKTILDGNELFAQGDRSLWYRVQPYLIGIFTAKGIPMLWQGQEFAENYFVPYQGWGRVMLYRPVRWDFFYDNIGRSMVTLVRRLARLRNTHPELRGGEHWFYNDFDKYQSRGVLMFSRRQGDRFTLSALNFSESEQTVPFTFPQDGNYREILHGEGAGSDILGVEGGSEQMLTIPSNYGRVWSLEA